MILKNTLALGVIFHSSLLFAETTFIEPPMVSIPAGTLVLSSGDEVNPSQYEVNIASFMVAKYEVTNLEFRQFIRDSGYQTPSTCIHEMTEGWYTLGATDGSWDNNDQSKKDFEPVTCAGWQAATDYARWLSDKTGRPYRLLTDSEWTYAAKGNMDTPYYSQSTGDINEVCEYANIADKTAVYDAELTYGAKYVFDGYNNPTVQCDDKAGFVSIVGMYKANPFGLYDMVGNITEFVQDCENKEVKTLPNNGKAQLSGNCEHRGLKGGSWHWQPMSIERTGFMPKSFIGSIEGFRLALDLEQSSGSHTEQSEATKRFEAALTNAHEKELARRDKLPPIINTLPIPKNLKLIELANNHKQLSWDKVPNNIANEGLTYRVYRGRFLDNNSYKLLATGIKGNSYLDKSAITGKKAVYFVKAEQGRSASIASEVITGKDIHHTVPGKIEAEFANEQSGMIIAGIAGKEAKKQHLGWIADNDWIELLIDVKDAGDYIVTYRVASPEGGELIELSLNDALLHSVNIESTGSYNDFKMFSDKAALSLGKHKLRINAKQGGWNIDWIDFTKM